jgi:outer membrane lipoprotein-sorting protein
MSKAIFLCGFLASCAYAHAQYAGYSLLSNTTAFKQAFAAATQKTESIKSDFVQEKNLSVLSQKIVSRGKFWFKRNNRVRMEYTSPFTYLMILANNHIYIKDGQHENDLSSKSSKLLGQINELIMDCVKGTVLSNPDFHVRVFEGSQTYLLELSPVSAGLKDFFENVRVIIDKKDFSASAIDMQEPSGDFTNITFVHKELNTPIPDALFTIH